MGLLLTYALVAVAGYLLVREFRFAMTGIRTERWRMTDGTLASASSDTQATDEAACQVRYGYEVEGSHYTSGQIGYGFPTAMPDSFRARIVQPVLADAPSVKVFYDPRKPEESVLMTGFQPYNAWRMAPLVVMLFCGLLVLLT